MFGFLLTSRNRVWHSTLPVLATRGTQTQQPADFPESVFFWERTLFCRTIDPAFLKKICQKTWHREKNLVQFGHKICPLYTSRKADIPFERVLNFKMRTISWTLPYSIMGSVVTRVYYSEVYYFSSNLNFWFPPSFKVLPFSFSSHAGHISCIFYLVCKNTCSRKLLYMKGCSQCHWQEITRARQQQFERNWKWQGPLGKMDFDPLVLLLRLN